MPLEIKTLIIEDEASAINRLKKELLSIPTISFDIQGEFGSIRETVDWLENKHQVDLIFMDIHLIDGLSFEIFKQVNVSCPVIFTTAYDEYAIKAFKLNSIDYLLKPIEPEELQHAINRFVELNSHTEKKDYLNQLIHLASEFKPTKYRSSFLVSYRHKMRMIDVNEVAYLFIKERGVFLMQKDSTEYVVDFFLDDMEQQLDPNQFYRANRQFLISRSSIHEIEPYFNGRLVLSVEPKAHTPVVVSKEKASNFKRWADS